MSKISRRSLVKGAAWSAPVVLTTATIPAYAASNCPDVTASVVESTNSVGEAVVTVTFTGSQKWGAATLTANGARIIDEPEPSDTDTLEVTAMVEPTYQIILVIDGCEPVVVQAREQATRQYRHSAGLDTSTKEA